MQNQVQVYGAYQQSWPHDCFEEWLGHTLCEPYFWVYDAISLDGAHAAVRTVLTGAFFWASLYEKYAYMMPPVNPMPTPMTFLGSNSTSPNMNMPSPVVKMSFIWPAWAALPSGVQSDSATIRAAAASLCY